MIRICIWLEFSYLFGEGDMTRARGLNQLAIEVSAIGSMFLAGAIFFAASWVMPAWTHHVVRSDPVLLAILLCSAVLNACWSVTSSLLMGTNQHEGFTMRYISAAALTILLAAISVPRLGLHGVALSMVACECLVLPYVVSRTCQLLHQPLKDLVMNSIQLRMVRQISAAYYHRWLGNRG
jgi:O-antigen/teichoic acid export membrane protein